MKKKNGILRSIIAMVVVFTFVVSAAFAQDLVIKGTQIRGTGGKNGEIKSTPVKLAKDAKIVKVEGAPEGFCVFPAGDNAICGGNELIGRVLKAGSYTAYPNLPKGKDQMTVSIYVK
jgi:hypothetical protein